MVQYDVREFVSEAASLARPCMRGVDDDEVLTSGGDRNGRPAIEGDHRQLSDALARESGKLVRGANQDAKVTSEVAGLKPVSEVKPQT